MPSNSIANSQFLINSQLVNSQITNSLLQNTNATSITLENSINSEIEKFNDLNIENNEQKARYDTNGQLDISKKINIDGTDLTLINTYEYSVKAALLKIERINNNNNNNNTFRLTVKEQLTDVIINTTYSKEYREYKSDNILIDSILRCSGYCVEGGVPAILFIEGKLFKILFINGHIPNNDGTYSYEIELISDNLNEFIAINNLTKSIIVLVMGNKSLFNCGVRKIIERYGLNG